VVRYPPQLDDAGFRELMAGIHQACTDFGTLNVGGDIGNAERIILSASALGVCSPGQVLTRGGARPGDLLCVTGSCGVLGAAVAYFPKKAERGWELPPDVEEELLAGWRRPVARVAEGRVLSSNVLATACQDTSDGLKATIEQIGSASGVGFDVAVGSVRVDRAVSEVARVIGVGELALSMSASADFQLAFTVAPADLDACQNRFRALGLDFDVIGTATDSGEVRALAPDGTATPLPGVAWKHQKSDISTLVSDSP
jgi:thiamine-monophosphate kinase